MKILKILTLCLFTLCLLLFGAALAYGTEQTIAVVKQHMQFKTAASPTIVPTPMVTPTPTATPTPHALPTKIPTPTALLAAEITPPSEEIPTPTGIEKLSIQAFDPPFLWADYIAKGQTEAIITGTGFRPGTVVELFGPHDPFEKINSKDIVYKMPIITVLSSHQMKVNIPAGLYNAHYSIRATNPDKTYVERDSILVVNGETGETNQ